MDANEFNIKLNALFNELNDLSDTLSNASSPGVQLGDLAIRINSRLQEYQDFLQTLSAEQREAAGNLCGWSIQQIEPHYQMFEKRRVVDDVYAFLGQKQFDAYYQAFQIAQSALSSAEGPVLLALHEAIAQALDKILSELGEHGLQNRALFQIKPDQIDVAGWVQACADSYKEIRRLRDAGVDSEPLIKVYMDGWIYPIGSPDWINSLRLSVKHRDAPWVQRLARIIKKG